jgi:hypothetical protein
VLGSENSRDVLWSTPVPSCARLLCLVLKVCLYASKRGVPASWIAMRDLSRRCLFLGFCGTHALFCYAHNVCSRMKATWTDVCFCTFCAVTNVGSTNVFQSSAIAFAAGLLWLLLTRAHHFSHEQRFVSWVGFDTRRA